MQTRSQPATNGTPPVGNGTLGLDRNRFSLLKKPAAGQPDPYAALRRPVTPAR